MMTEFERNFSVASARRVEAELYWLEVTAKCDYEMGHISREEFERVKRLHAKAERVLDQRCEKPYRVDYHKGFYVWTPSKSDAKDEAATA